MPPTTLILCFQSLCVRTPHYHDPDRQLPRATDKPRAATPKWIEERRHLYAGADGRRLSAVEDNRFRDVATHLHVDHVGWNPAEGGRWDSDL